MAKEPVVKIEGNEMDKILTVAYGLVNQADADGRPTKNRRSIGITVTRIADDNKFVAGWAEKTSAETRKAGTVEFFHQTGKSMKTLEWDGAYVMNYNVGYDQASDHAVESFVIMPEKLGFESDVMDFKWEPGS